MSELHVIIPAGGAGTRLWPLSRRDHPKFLLDLLGTGRSLLQTTVDRLTPLAASITVVTGKAHAHQVREQLAGSSVAVLVEPSPRDSMAAIGLAAYTIRQRFGRDAIIGSFAADHAIADQEAFAEAVQQASIGARRGFLTTIGIAPQGPSTAYGYIEPGEPLVADLRKVKRFVEKPDAEDAAEYLAQGYLWNAGMFVFSFSTLETSLRRYLPAMAESLDKLAHQGMDVETWDSLQRIAIDYALAEPLASAGQVAVVPARFDWSDIGDFAALAELTGPHPEAAFVRSDKFVSVVGLPQAIVVETADAILVTDVAHAQQVKTVVEGLERQGRGGLL